MANGVCTIVHHAYGSRAKVNHHQRRVRMSPQLGGNTANWLQDVGQRKLEVLYQNLPAPKKWSLEVEASTDARSSCSILDCAMSSMFVSVSATGLFTFSVGRKDRPFCSGASVLRPHIAFPGYKKFNTGKARNTGIV
jgi:hypothetical protein